MEDIFPLVERPMAVVVIVDKLTHITKKASDITIKKGYLALTIKREAIKREREEISLSITGHTKRSADGADLFYYL